MEITVNGKPVTIEFTMSLAQFVDSRGFKFKTVVVEYNDEIVKAQAWDGIVLKPHDRLEIVTFVGGG
ncbi:MAG: thiamine biosynthesis protein ThiS [Firmicutes bacterium]|nr:thiamine biosynthesis protein ThiS [Bacillota bacterium]